MPWVGGKLYLAQTTFAYLLTECFKIILASQTESLLYGTVGPDSLSCLNSFKPFLASKIDPTVRVERFLIA